MSEQTTLKVNITKKTKKGWSIHTEVKYPSFTHPANTYSGAGTLGHALWLNLDPNSYVTNTQLISITVNGQDMTPADAYNRIEKELIDGAMSYALPRYKAFLQ
jgi:hypothetical protein